MASQGPRYPGTAASLANAGTSENAEAWVTPANIGADDANEATITAATYDSPDISQLLVASNFGFTIPAGSTIDGIIVEIMRRNSVGAASDNRVQLATGTTFADLVGNNKADLALDWPTAEAQASYGTSTDTWASGLTVAQINATGFAVFLSVQADAANTDIQVDYIRVTVHYTAPVASTISPGGLAAADALGTPSQYSLASIIATALGSGETVAQPTLLPGAVAVSPTGLASDEAIGSSTLYALATILAEAIASGESVSSPIVLPGGVLVTVNGLTSEEVLGAVIVSVSTTGSSILPSGITGAEALGSHALVPVASILPTALASDEAFGSHQLVPVSRILAQSVESAEAFGTHQLAPVWSILPSSVGSAEALGSPTFIPVARILAQATDSSEAFGSINLKAVAVVIPPAIDSEAALGLNSVSPGPVTVVVAGLDSASALGSVIVVALAPGINILPSAIDSDAAFGSATLVPRAFINASAIGSDASFGTTLLLPGEVLVEVIGLNSGEVIGAAIVNLASLGSAIQFTHKVGFGSTRRVGWPSARTEGDTRAAGWKIASKKKLGSTRKG